MRCIAFPQTPIFPFLSCLQWPRKRFQANPEFVISDLDVSQNKLTVDQFQTLFLLLGTAGVRVMRFRMFGCATLTDEVLKVMSDYLRALGADAAPNEMHLSDCAITAEGFRDLCSALEETELFPRPVAPNSDTGHPLYLRMENNYIEEALAPLENSPETEFHAVLSWKQDCEGGHSRESISFAVECRIHSMELKKSTCYTL
ncbi:wdr83 [Symbiodinium pilosum]|uniref:Wdr83 protein n=1 Tax=Symbiodinium pilosum TaxID=2952 RepID=A0A812SUE1_SYMPI|nr:wdr83 [Symbiodinium pilosum]